MNNNNKKDEWKYPEPFDLLLLLYSVVSWDWRERQQEVLSELFLPPFSRSNLVKEHLAC